MALIYKVCSADAWASAEATGVFAGAEVDLADGFIHLSTASQVADTVRLHFAGQEGLVLVAFDEGALGDALRYEPSRGGNLFPHLYGPLKAPLAIWVRPLAPDGQGGHVMPPLGR